MKSYFFLILSMFSVMSLEVQAVQVSAKFNHSCATDNKVVKCWGGDNAYGQLDVPYLKNPSFVSAGFRHTCAIANNKVKCWGSNEYGESTPPRLYNPRYVSAGGAHTCAIDDRGIICWGDNTYGQTNVPVLNNPQTLSAGSDFSCAVDDGRVKCWGLKPWSSESLDNFPAVNAFVGGQGSVVALSEDSYDFWSPTTNLPFPRPEFITHKNLKQFALGLAHFCMIDDSGLRCFGDNFAGQIDIPAHLKNVQDVAAGRLHTCAVTGKKVLCWGDNSDGQLDVPWYFSR